MKLNEIKKRNRSIPISVVGSIVIIAAGLIFVALFLFHLYQQNRADAPVIEDPIESESVQPSELPAPNYLALSIDVEESETLSQLYYLVACDADPAEQVPTFFVGKKIAFDFDASLAEEDARLEQAENYMHTYSDAMFYVKQDTSVTQFEDTDYLSNCICVQNDRYIFIAASEAQAAAARYFEQQINDPTVLDMEDLLLRMQNYKG